MLATPNDAARLSSLTPEVSLQAIESDPFLTQCRDAGLFDEAPIPPSRIIECLPNNEGVSLAFRLGNREVGLVSQDSGLADQVRCILERYLSASPSRTVDLFVSCDGESRSVFEDGDVLTDPMDRDEARYHVLRCISERLLGREHVGAHLHASAAAKGGRSIILTGDSGSGKTTTALGLLAAGCKQIADDHLPLHADGCRAVAFPSKIGAKPGAWHLPEVAPLLETGDTTVRDGVHYVTAPLQAQPGTAYEVAAIVLPEFDPGGGFGLTRISPEQAFLALFEAGARVGRGTGAVAPLVGLLNNVPVYHMLYESSAQSVPACLSLLEQA